MTELTGARDKQQTWRFAVAVTSARDGLEHLVAEEAMTPESAGLYVALCQRSVWAAALACPPGPRCLTCIAVRDADATNKRQQSHPDQRGVWARLTAFLRRPHPTRS